jgi:hypothetical protein
MSLKDGWNCGFESFFEKTFYEELISSLCIKVYFESWVKLFHLSNVGIILGSKIGYLHGKCCPKSWIVLWNANLGSPILVGQARKLVFNSPTPIFVHGNLSIKKTCVTCVESHKLVLTLGLEEVYGFICFTLQDCSPSLDDMFGKHKLVILSRCRLLINMT